MVLILDLSLGQRGFVHRAPQHGLLALVHAASFHEFAELTEDGRLIIVGHREIRMLPIPEHSQSLKLIALDLEEFVRIVSAEFPYFQFAERFLFLAQFLQHLVLDGKAVAIPPRYVRRVIAFHRLRFHDDVLEDLIERMTDVDSTIGIRRAVVQDVTALGVLGFLNLLVKPLLLPFGKHHRFAFREVCLHRKVRLREIERRFIVHH